MKKKRKYKKLKDLNIKYISVIEGEHDPANQEAKQLFVKGEQVKKEEENMEEEKTDVVEEKVESAIQKFFKNLLGKKQEEPEKEEAPPMEKADPAYITKEDFDGFSKGMNEKIEALTKAIGTFKEEQNKIYTGMYEAFQEDLGSLKKSLIIEKRKESPVEPQAGILELLAARNPGGQAMNLGQQGQAANYVVQKEYEEGRLNEKKLPGIATPFDEAIRATCDMGVEF